jgi:Glyoxalase/Bleomycin resistance protein/Dioxygenase superfamily
MTGDVVLHHDDLFHTGIVVDDLAAARDALGRDMGLTWREGGAAVRLITEDGARTVQTAYALSCEGPHHVELVQSIEDTLWTVPSPGHAHHLGWWVDDVAAADAALRRRGAEHLGTVAMTDEAAPMCAYFRLNDGPCVEIVDRAFKRVLLPDVEARR